MNKIIQINLGGVAYTLEEDAYEILKTYLERIRVAFSNTTDSAEIIQDFESRIAELLQENNPGVSIFTAEHVKQSTAQMGEPDQIFDESNANDSMHSSKTSSSFTQNIGKRLFRHGQDKIISGVCSGLAHYLGIKDPLWVRLGFVALVWFFGMSVWAYLILWLILPEAKSPSDYLEMQGKPITFDNINKIMNEGVEKVRNFANDKNRFSEGFNFTNKRTIFENLGDILSKILTVFLIFIGVIFLVTALITFFSLTFSFIMAGVVMPDIIGGSVFYDGILFLSFYLLIIIPIVFIILWFISFLRKKSFNGGYYLAGLGIWAVCLLICIGFAIKLFSNFSTHQYITREVNIEQPITDTLNLNIVDRSSISNSFHLSNFDLNNLGNPLIGDDIDVYFENSPDNQFHLIEKIGSFGKNPEEAKANAKELRSEYSHGIGFIDLPNKYALPKGTPWRVQAASIEVQIPKGRFVKLGSDMSKYFDFHIREGKSFRNFNKLNDGDILFSEGSNVIVNGFEPLGESFIIDGDTQFEIKKDFGEFGKSEKIIFLDMNNIPESTSLSNTFRQNSKDIRLVIKPVLTNSPKMSAFLKAQYETGRHDLSFTMINYPVSLKDGNVSLGPSFNFDPQRGWYNPELRIELEIPVGYKLRIDRSLKNYIESDSFKEGHSSSNLLENTPTTWVVDQAGLQLIEER